MTSENSSEPFILVIDEAPPLLRLIQLELGFQGFRTDSMLLDKGPVEKAVASTPDAIVLGSQVPFPLVYDVLAKLKAAVAAPVLFIHAAGNDSDGAVALQSGADDVLPSPYLPEDLAMRLRILLGYNLPEVTEIRRAGLKIDAARRLVWHGDQKLALATTEWALLLRLATTHTSLAPSELLTSVWGEEYANELSFLALWIDRLRANLDEKPGHPEKVLGEISQGFWLAD